MEVLHFTEINEKFDLKYIFNANKTTCLFFKCLPNKILAFNRGKYFGDKQSNELVTLMVCCNVTGTEKRKFLIVNESKNLRFF